MKKAWVLYQNVLPGQLRSRALLVYAIYALLLIFLTTWNADETMVNLAGFTVGDLEERTFAFQDAFFDYVFMAYIPLLPFYVRSHILGPVAESYTVSNSLWLRLAPTKPLTLALYRLLIVIGGTLILWSVSFVWSVLFALWHGLPLGLLQQSIFSLAGYTLLTGGLITLCKGRPTHTIELRQAFVWMIMLVPIGLYVFRAAGTSRLGAFYPFAAPYLKHNIGADTFNGTLAAAVLGLALLLANATYSYLKFPNTTHN